jgi:CBS domain-containing protein
VDTSEIRYRVADFLKQHPPFNAVDDADLVALAANGRVRFFPNDEFLAWQGEPHKTHVLVIQQGTVSMWDEQSGQAELRDVRGPGDWIGAEQFHGARSCLYTARATSDVVTYGFPAYEVEQLLEKYPYVASFVAAMGSVDSGFTRSDTAASPLTTYLQTLAGPLRSCGRETSVRDAARLLLDTGAEALAVTDDKQGLLGVVTARAVLAWIADGADDPSRAVSELGLLVPGCAGPDTSIAEGAWRMIANGAVAMTDDGTPKGRLLTVITPRDLLPSLGDQPAAIVEAIQSAPDVARLRALNQRTRAFVLKYLTSPESVEWMLGYIGHVDGAILTRVFELTAPEVTNGCWCVWGAWGRGGSLIPRAPHLMWMQEGGSPAEAVAASYGRLTRAFAECGYLAGPDPAHEPPFYVARLEEWRRRYVGWMRNPVLEGMQRSRSLFDLRWVAGTPDLTPVIQKDVQNAVDRDILQVLAHDCLADLPPLSFYEDAVVEHSGEVSDVFRLQRNVLQPLVDLGRVFGMAAGSVMGISTFERLAAARRLLPEHERIFREASEALRVVLWQQGRVAISHGTIGAELPPSAMSRHDRHLLKSTFPVIQRLIEFAADPSWLSAVDAAVDRDV